MSYESTSRMQSPGLTYISKKLCPDLVCGVVHVFPTSTSRNQPEQPGGIAIRARRRRRSASEDLISFFSQGCSALSGHQPRSRPRLKPRVPIRKHREIRAMAEPWKAGRVAGLDIFGSAQRLLQTEWQHHVISDGVEEAVSVQLI